MFRFPLAGSFLFVPSAMHIPDGYLSPLTCLIMFLLVLPFWIKGFRRIREQKGKNFSLIALSAAFSFIVMLFNLPLPGGTTGHVTGAALAAIILGPEIASIAISITLVLQAFMFSDGGVLSIGANSFNMAVIIPYLAAAVYVFFQKYKISAHPKILGAGIAGWVSLVGASFFTALEFGLQPYFFVTPNNVPLYAPYPLTIAIPAMVIPHILIVGVVEGLVTAAIMFYFLKTNNRALSFLKNEEESQDKGKINNLWFGLLALLLFVPIGLLAPGTAWGEWSGQELAKRDLGFIPTGLAKLTNLWHAPFLNYKIPFFQDPSWGYFSSALVGVGTIVFLVWLLSNLFPGKTEEKKKTE